MGGQLLSEQLSRIRINWEWSLFLLFLLNPDYSQIEFAADAGHRVCGCGSSLQMPCNEADAVKSARPKGKLSRHIIKRNAFETD